MHEEIGQASEKIISLKPHKRPSSQIGKSKDFIKRGRLGAGGEGRRIGPLP